MLPDEACLNCGAERTGAYCHACGQRYRGERLTTRYLARHFVKQFFNLDDGLLHTVQQLTVAPGRVARAYINGRVRPYVNPVGYLLLVSAISIIIFSLLEGYFIQAIVQDFQTNGTSLSEFEGIQELLGPNPDQRFAELLMRGINQATVYLSLLLCLPFALFVQWFVPGWKQAFTYAESLVFSLYVYAHSILLSAVFVYPLVPLHDSLVMASSWIVLGLQTVYCAVAARGFHQRSWTTVLMTGLAFVAAYIVFFALLLAAIMVGFVIVGIWMSS